ncbi:GPI mannosyltransferase [Kalmanozyma brasiliensis GHG001]|uniref:Mannosyltransferase n=1 Tax=Kalmanozyma brasiliensis (strain GHG001) TaxID=1365824 RepID=V5EE54_KALBG|nr:GPI mannosyltransferase [Kalmanozyma brasiliensis GHG001]EST08761.1 GPI mannosyltransferase [Kalmanozyma brasiliensis GHG001]
MPTNATGPQRWWSMFDPRTRHGQIYLSLLSLRCFSAFFGYGYIHPDEWMQSGEPYFGFKDIGIDVRLPWEWMPNNALRSFSSLSSQYRSLDILLPLVKRLGPLSGRSLFMIQRANMLLETVLVDVIVAAVLPPQTARLVHYLFGISTAATTFLVRPFSNSHELTLLALCLLQTLALYQDRTWYRHSNLGGWHWGVLFATLAVDGLFTRFTFAIFALPVTAFFVYRFKQVATEGFHKPALLSLAIGVVTGIGLLGNTICSETSFYTRFANATGTELASMWGTKWVVPPINALLYNMKTDNVAQHGLHPRWLHVVVNMPMMVGIANCVVIAIHGWHSIRDTMAPDHTIGVEDLIEEEEVEQVIEIADAPSQSEKKSTASTSARAVELVDTTEKADESAMPSTSTDAPASTPSPPETALAYIDVSRLTTALCLCTILFSLLILSLSPHQEPRFLLPLALPSTILMALAFQSPYFTVRPRFTRILLILHVAQHILQLLLFSFLHQAALLPTLFHIDHSLSRLPLTGNALFDRYEHHLLYRTFSVPLHLIPRKGRGMFPRVEHYDSSTSPAGLLYPAGWACDDTWLYAPSWVVAQLQEAAEKGGNVVLIKERVWTGHVDMDHLPETLALVKKIGWTEAFAIHKLHVRCSRTVVKETEEVAQTATHQETEDKAHTALHAEL